MTDLTKFDVPFSDLERQLVGLMEEALSLRFGDRDEDPKPTLPPLESGPSEVHSSLLRVRRRLDRLEGILSAATRAKGRASRAAVVAKQAADDAWDVSNNADRNSSVQRGQSQYIGPKERYADANLSTLPQQIDARSAARLADVADEVLSVIRLCHRGLSDIRQDHLSIMRSYQFESTLDRG